jgi:primosomal protein N' (replication factor Y)
VVRVVPDVPAVDREFDYVVPPAVSDRVQLGTRVRVVLHGRRVGGWVVGEGGAAPDGVARAPISRVSGPGPAPELIRLARWAAWRWAGSVVSLLRTASPEGAVETARHDRVASVPAQAGRQAGGGDGSGAGPVLGGSVVGGSEVELAREGLALGRAVLQVPPAGDAYGVVAAAAAGGSVLVVTPTAADAAAVAARLRRAGRPVALLPKDWGRAFAGGCDVVGPRGAAWGPAPDATAIIVLDGHDEGLRQEQAPTWNAWQVAVERAGQAGRPCLVVSPCPTLELLAWGRLLRPPRQAEREGWAPLEVLDPRGADPREARFPGRLVNRLRAGGPAVVVLNRKGRARLLACAACGELARCELCGAAAEAAGRAGPAAGALPAEGLRCRRCGTGRPAVCAACGSQRLKLLRPGVGRIREELTALLGEEVGELTAESVAVPATRVLVGTEAALYRVPTADLVAFLEFDQELLAPRYRAAEEALALLARASRLVGGRLRGGQVVVQSRVPDHDVLEAARAADPGRLAETEWPRRVELRMPPEAAIALLSGPEGERYADALRAAAVPTLEVLGPASGRWLVRAPDHSVLCDALAATPRPPGRLRVEVDPARA